METTYSYNESTVIETAPTFWDRIVNFFQPVWVIAHFVPIICSIGWMVIWLCGAESIWAEILAIPMLIGYCCILISCPFKLICSIVRGLFHALLTGLRVWFFPANLAAAAVCVGAVATFFLGGLLYVPAAFTLYYFFTE